MYIEVGNNQTLGSPGTITAWTTATYLLTRVQEVHTLLCNDCPRQQVLSVNPLDKRHSSNLCTVHNEFRNSELRMSPAERAFLHLENFHLWTINKRLLYFSGSNIFKDIILKKYKMATI